MGARRKEVSIYTIAAESGVSHNTISLALQGSERVRPETRERIVAIAKRLGYRPNLLARAVITGRSRFLGVLIPGLDFSYMPRLLQAIQDVALQRGYGLLFVSHAGEVSAIEQHIEYFLARRVEGLIVIPPAPPPPPAVWQPLAASATSVVFLQAAGKGIPGHSLRLSPGEAGRLAVRKLAELGHRRLAYAGPEDDFFSRGRRAGVYEAGRKEELPPPADWSVPDNIAGGEQAAACWLKAAPRPTGVVCFSDTVAVGFLHALLREGVRLPQEVSVVGVDDTPLAEAAAVPLTTLRAPAAAMGRCAAEILLGEPQDEKPIRHQLHWQWVDRASCGPPPGK